MHFTNDQITIEQLPKVEEVELQGLQPSYLTAQKIAIGIASAIILIAAICLYFFVDELRDNNWFYISTGVVLLILILVLISSIISFKKKGFALREKDVLYRSGWLVEKTRIVPLNRVQHVSVQSGPIERKFGLASVSLFTAGNENADFSIKGLTKETAEQVKEWITIQINGRNGND